MYRGPSTEAALLARSAPRSEQEPEHDPEHGLRLPEQHGPLRMPEHGPRIEVADNIVMHPVTGAFTDPAHESAFASRLFRAAFPSHAFVMALSLAAR